MRIKIVVAVSEDGLWTCAKFDPEKTDWRTLKESLNNWETTEDRTYYLVEANVPGYERILTGKLADSVTRLD